MVPLQIDKDLLTPREVAGRMSIALRTLWRLVERGGFPQPIRFTRKLVRWKAVSYTHLTLPTIYSV